MTHAEVRAAKFALHKDELRRIHDKAIYTRAFRPRHRSSYFPHQSDREMARRVRQMARATYRRSPDNFQFTSAELTATLEEYKRRFVDLMLRL